MDSTEDEGVVAFYIFAKKNVAQFAFGFRSLELDGQ